VSPQGGPGEQRTPAPSWTPPWRIWASACPITAMAVGAGSVPDVSLSDSSSATARMTATGVPFSVG
jgi:hypothetical protein